MTLFYHFLIDTQLAPDKRGKMIAADCQPKGLVVLVKRTSPFDPLLLTTVQKTQMLFSKYEVSPQKKHPIAVERASSKQLWALDKSETLGSTVSRKSGALFPRQALPRHINLFCFLGKPCLVTVLNLFCFLGKPCLVTVLNLFGRRVPTLF
jgi:hypothetical protein